MCAHSEFIIIVVWYKTYLYLHAWKKFVVSFVQKLRSSSYFVFVGTSIELSVRLQQANIWVNSHRTCLFLFKRFVRLSQTSHSIQTFYKTHNNRSCILLCQEWRIVINTTISCLICIKLCKWITMLLRPLCTFISFCLICTIRVFKFSDYKSYKWDGHVQNKKYV